MFLVESLVINVCLCVYLHTVIFANWTILMYVHAICYVFIVQLLLLLLLLLYDAFLVESLVINVFLVESLVINVFLVESLVINMMCSLLSLCKHITLFATN